VAGEWDIGDLVLPDGRLVLCDPLLFVTPEWALEVDLPPGEHAVDVYVVDDPHGGERIDQAAIFLADEEPARWDFLGDLPVDSGVFAFASAEAARRLLDDDDPLVEELLDDLRANRRPTWESGGAAGVVGCTGGLGDGFASVSLGLDERGEPACLAVAFLAEGEIAESPGRHLERAFLVPARFGGSADPRNVVPVAAELNRAMTTVERTAGRALLSGSAVDLEVIPRYEGDSRVPVELKATLRTDPPSG
jgi:hypothetical protein